MSKSKYHNNQVAAFRGHDSKNHKVKILHQHDLKTLVSIGLRNNLFEIINKTTEVSLSEIVSRSGLNKHYLREWLHLMVRGHIIDYNIVKDTYCLSISFSSFLLKTLNDCVITSPSPLSKLMNRTELSYVIDNYNKHSGINSTRNGNETKNQISLNSSAIIRYDFVHILLPQQQKLINLLEKGISVLEIGCGNGELLVELAKKFPKSTFYGLDLSRKPTLSYTNEKYNFSIRNVCINKIKLLEYEPSQPYDLIISVNTPSDYSFSKTSLRLINYWMKENGQFVTNRFNNTFN